MKLYAMKKFYSNATGPYNLFAIPCSSSDVESIGRREAVSGTEISFCCTVTCRVSKNNQNFLNRLRNIVLSGTEKRQGERKSVRHKQTIKETKLGSTGTSVVDNESSLLFCCSVVDCTTYGADDDDAV